ncbi:hypothetical protein [Eubacterium pyruvativorans]|uniref:hypothetical protein n=1 Tax=Eubacterium pyruvativorans TaxID=155865 RepID=UPI003F8B8EA9
MNTVKTEMIRDAKKSVGGSSFMTTVEVAAWRHEDRRTVERKFKRCGIEKHSGRWFIPEIVEVFL